MQARHLTRKDLLKKHLQRQMQLSERAAEAYDIMPLTFTLPSEFLAFTDAFARSAEEEAEAEAALAEAAEDGTDTAVTPTPNVWIMKPVEMCMHACMHTCIHACPTSGS